MMLMLKIGDDSVSAMRQMTEEHLSPTVYFPPFGLTSPRKKKKMP